MFANDTGGFVTHPNKKIINKHANKDLNSILKWLGINKLSLNYAKTKYVLFETT